MRVGVVDVGIQRFGPVGSGQCWRWAGGYGRKLSGLAEGSLVHEEKASVPLKAAAVAEGRIPTTIVEFTSEGVRVGEMTPVFRRRK